MKVIWDELDQRYYETGVDHGVLYPIQEGGTYTQGYAWNGLSKISEKPSGAEPKEIYADNILYMTLVGAEKFGATVEAYTAPDEFAECDGSAALLEGVMIGQQRRKTFGLCYRTMISGATAEGYKLHLVYGATAKPTEKSYQTINDSPEAQTMSWELSTTPVAVENYKPTSVLTIDSTKVDATKLAALENILYGKNPTSEGGADGAEARLPLPGEVIRILSAQG